MFRMAPFLFWPVAALAQTQAAPFTMADSIASMEAGVICAPEAVGEIAAPDTIAGSTHTIDISPPFVSTGAVVPAVIGVGFGVKAMSAALEGIDNVTVVVTHPPMGPDGTTRQSYQTAIGGVSSSLTFYQFDYAYELQTGAWQIDAVKDEVLLFSARFTVVPPQQVPELAGVCGFLDLLS